MGQLNVIILLLGYTVDNDIPTDLPTYLPMLAIVLLFTCHEFAIIEYSLPRILLCPVNTATK